MEKSFPKTLKEVQLWLSANIKADMTLAVDTETDGLHYNCKLKGISLCTGTNAVYINLEDNTEFDAIVDLILKTICEVKLLIGHNISFDLRVLTQYGLEL
jgi:DNA polymerase I-like protein with 3'-5' exonuclease and polymerase domains